MDINAASKRQKLQWVKDGEHINILIHDANNWVKIAARGKRIELREAHRKQELQDLRNSMSADLFEVIQLSAKTDKEVYELISQNKYLTYFAGHVNMSYRVRAKKRIKDYLKEIETRDDSFGFGYYGD